MKHFLHNSLRALFLSLAVLLSLPMLAKSVWINGINYDLVAESKEAAVISKSSDNYSSEVVIPESVEHEGTTYSVTSIGDNVFSYYSGLTSVSIPNSVTSIGARAFYKCSGLTSLTIPNSVTSIGEEAFYDCINLTSVVLPNNLTRIERRTFFNCSSLNTITIPNTVRSIGVGAIYGCKSLNSIIIPPSVTLIEEYAFQECTGLSSVHISDLTSWCNITFEKMLSNPLYLAGHLFLNGKEIKDLIIPSGVTKIGYAGFCGGAGFTSVSIPNSVTSIGEWAFSYCSGLTSVTIGNGVTSIGSDAFLSCPELLDVYCYAENVPSTSSSAFDWSNYSNATLHVPTASIDSYKATEPWSSFGKIVGLSAENKTYEYIDLGLPSGTLWATFNVGATQPHESGYYLAWGELEEKSVYNLSTYFDKEYLLYNRNNRSICETEHDAATVLWGQGWCMPTYEQAVELYNKCNWDWTDNYNNTGVSGMICVGPNGNSIFFPAAGLMQGESLSYTNYGNYWTGEIDEFWGSSNYVAFIDFNKRGLIHSNFSSTSADYRYWGRNVRPVVNKNSNTEPDTPETKVCATPVVTYAEGKLSFSCETEGAEFVTEITDSDIKKHYDAEIELSLAYNIEVFATKAGCENSDTVSVALVWVENGDVSEETGVISVEATPVLIQGNGGVLYISGVAKDTEIIVYTVSGTEVARATAAEGTTTINTGLQSGIIAVVKFGNKSVKVRI